MTIGDKTIKAIPVCTDIELEAIKSAGIIDSNNPITIPIGETFPGGVGGPTNRAILVCDCVIALMGTMFIPFLFEFIAAPIEKPELVF